MVSVKYDNISIAYDDFIAVEGVTLAIPDGEITTLLGPSGCGKTTLLRSLAGFVDPFTGSIFLGEKDVTILSPQRRNTAMIFQNYALWPHMTIFKNVEYGLKLRLKEKIVFQIEVKDEKEKIESVTFNSYGSPEILENATTKVVPLVEGLNIEEAWNLTCEKIIETDDELAKLRSRKAQRFASYIIGSLRKTIRFYYIEERKEIPEWIPEKPTDVEKTKIRQPFYLYFFWLTKPFFFITRKSYLDKKEELDPAWKFRRKKVNDVLDIVHLADQAEKHPTELSGGQQQRIALARSIVVEPDVLLCDEPLSNLDAKLRKELRMEIRSIIKNIGMTAVYVTHDQSEALAISDRIAVMNVGFVEQYGKPMEIFDDPKTLFVAQFIGESTTLTGKIDGVNKVLLEGGETIEIITKEKIPKGTEVKLVVRPSDITVSKDGTNSISIKIHTIEYLGTEIKMSGTLKDGTILLIDILEDIETTASRNVGDKMDVYIKTDEIFVFVEEKRVY